jgi:hypothetical protein
VVAAPGAGRFTASATTTVTLKITTGHGTHRRTHRRKSKLNYGSASATASGAGTLTFKLRPLKNVVALLKSLGKLKVSLSVTFAPTGGTPLTKTVTLTVNAPPKHHKRRHK